MLSIEEPVDRADIDILDTEMPAKSESVAVGSNLGSDKNIRSGKKRPAETTEEVANNAAAEQAKKTLDLSMMAGDSLVESTTAEMNLTLEAQMNPQSFHPLMSDSIVTPSRSSSAQRSSRSDETITPEMRREMHRATEQRRRTNLNMAMMELQHLLPERPYMTKTEVLHGACEYIRALLHEINELRVWRSNPANLVSALEQMRDQAQNKQKIGVEEAAAVAAAAVANAFPPQNEQNDDRNDRLPEN